MNARYEHDCKSCVFLGQHPDGDLYVHVAEKPIFTTVIARFGDRENYESGLVFAKPYKDLWGDMQPPFSGLAEARKRAIEAGYGDAIALAEGGAA